MPEEDLTKDMEDPTPVPNMEEVVLPKNGESAPPEELFSLFSVLSKPLFSSVRRCLLCFLCIFLEVLVSKPSVLLPP